MNHNDIEARALALLSPRVQAGFRVDPVLVARDLGMEVHLAEFYDQELLGLLVRRDGRKWIVVKSGADPVKQRFVIAHLVGHVVLHSPAGQEGDIPDKDPERYFFNAGGQEWEANEFALALLMPPYNLYKAVKGISSPIPLAQVLGVSLETLSYRMMGLLDVVVPERQERVG